MHACEIKEKKHNEVKIGFLRECGVAPELLSLVVDGLENVHCKPSTMHVLDARFVNQLRF